MNDPMGEPREVGGSDSVAMPVCPFVGRQSDPALVEAMPDGEHRCYKPPSPHRIRSDIQGRFCLSARYQRCPVYRGVVAHPPGPSLSERIFGGGLLGLITSPHGLAFIFFAMLIPAAIGVGFAILDDDDPAAEQAAAVADADGDAATDAAQQTPPAEAGGDAPAPAEEGTAPSAEDGQAAAGQEGAGQAAAGEQAAGEQAAGEQAPGEQAAGEQADEQAGEQAAASPPAADAEEPQTARERLFNWTDLTEHVVEAGDSLGAIAAVYGTTVEALAVFNGIADVNTIQVGQVLGVPIGFTEDLDFLPAAADATGDSPAPEEEGAADDPGGTDVTDGSEAPTGTEDTDATDDADGGTDDGAGDAAPDDAPAATESLLGWTDVVEWTVASGDTLFLIAQELSTTVDAIAALNGIDPADPILIGQVLRVPRGFLDPIE